MSLPGTATTVTTDASSRMPFPEANGRGLRIAVIDSGVNVMHPHIVATTRGVDFSSEPGDELEEPGDSWGDELGHGTAVMAAIQEKAPGAEYFAIKLFGKSLSATSVRLLRSIEWALNSGVDLINLSLGTHNLDYRPEFERLIQQSKALGAVLIGARKEGEQLVLPGMLDGVISVDVDWRLSRHGFRTVELEDKACYFASGFPRPIPGVSPVRNLSGISFAVANMTGIIARACEQTGARSCKAINEALLTENMRIQQ